MAMAQGGGGGGLPRLSRARALSLSISALPSRLLEKGACYAFYTVISNVSTWCSATSDGGLTVLLNCSGVQYLDGKVYERIRGSGQSKRHARRHKELTTRHYLLAALTENRGP